MSRLIIGLLALLFVLRFSDKSLLRPSNIFVIVWLSIAILFSLRFIPYDQPSNQTLLYIFLGVLSFTLGGKLSMNPKHSVDKYEIDYSKVLILQILTIIVYIPDAIESIKALMHGQSLMDIRTLSSEVSKSSGIIAILKNFILTPFIFLTYPIASYCFLSGKISGRKKYLILILSIIIICTSVLRLGGRSPILYFLVNFFVIWYFYRKEVRLSRISKLCMKVIVIALALGFFYSSLSRGIEDVPLSLYHYFSGCIALLDKGIESTIFHTYGVASFSSPIQLFDTIWRFFGGSQIELIQIVDWVNEKSEETIIVGDGIHMNAFYSLFYWFYLDFGAFGIIFMSFIYGFISDSIYKAAILNRKFVTIIILALLLQGIVFSFIRFQFTTHYYFLAFFIIPLVLKRKTNI